MSEKIKIVTFNLRCAYTEDGMNSFIHRAGMIFDKINEEKPDIICAQEAVPAHVKFFKKNLSDYITIYNGRTASFGGEGLALIIKKDRLNLLSLDFFWLSETPYVPGSRLEEQSSCPRICQAALFQINGTKSLFYVYNNHLDHKSDSARILGIKQVLEKVKTDRQRYELPLFILGDFNADPDSETIRYCNEYKDIDLVNLTADIGVTFHGFGQPHKYQSIDYIYTDYASAPRVTSVTKWDDEINGIFLSDHYPIAAEFEIES